MVLKILHTQTARRWGRTQNKTSAAAGLRNPGLQKWFKVHSSILASTHPPESLSFPVSLPMRHRCASQVALVVKNPPTMQETQEKQVRSLGQEDPLEEGMITHSSILAWRIPWTEEPGGLQSRRLHKSWT